MKHRTHLVFVKLRSTVLMLLSCWLFSANVQAQQAQQEIKFAVFDTLGYPLNIFDQSSHLTGGVLKDFGDAIAKEIGASTMYVVYSRRRVEQALFTGQADMVCYFSPQWTDNRDQLFWSLPNLPQIERVVVLRDKPVLNQFPQQLFDKKIATRLGYFYPQIDKEVVAGKIKRIDLTDVSSMFRLLTKGGADGLISSEAEIEGYFKNFPDQRDQFVLSKTPFSVLSTQCGLSQKSVWKIEQINRAIAHIQANGEQDAMLRRYGLMAK
ncbi:substrate-binding periplasmic protein [Undibacterium sp. Dicai25W]|uniref:substrate-binding periplasmic protein n=1 Tax=Undibacterium sp. Dicai25W TaxID=3413034 RepID=UPI003BF23C22